MARESAISDLCLRLPLPDNVNEAEPKTDSFTFNISHYQREMGGKASKQDFRAAVLDLVTSKQVSGALHKSGSRS